MRGLILEGPEASELALGLDDLLDAGSAEAADQLVLEVGVADVEAGLREVRAEARPLDGEPEVVLLAGVAQARDPDALGKELLEEAPDIPGASDRDDRDTLGREVAAAPDGERLDRELVAHAFDEDDGAEPAEGTRGQDPESVPRRTDQDSPLLGAHRRAASRRPEKDRR